MAVETVPWNQCLLCILRLRRPPTSSSRPNRLERAPLPFPLRFVPGAGSSPKRWPFPTPKLESWFPISRSSSAKGRASGLPLHLAVKHPPGLPAQRLSSCRLAMRHREGPRHLARRDDQGRLHACGVRRARAAVSGNRTRLLRSLVRCLALHRTEVRGSTVLRGPCRARPPRSSRALGHDELGHPGLAAASGERLRFRVGAAPAVTPVPVRPTSTTHDSSDKERELPTSWCTPLASHAIGSARYTPSISPRRTRSVSRGVVFLALGPERTSDASSSKPRLRRTSCGAPETPGPRQNDVRRRRPRVARCDDVTRCDLGSRPVDRGSLPRPA